MSGRVSYRTAALKAAAVILVLLSMSAWSRAYGEQRQKYACREEIARYCKGVEPGGGRILMCLKEHESDLSPTCRKKFDDIEKMVEEAEQACAVEIEKFCKGVQPGEGRLAKCLKGHFDEISPKCREKVNWAMRMLKKKASEQ